MTEKIICPLCKDEAESLTELGVCGDCVDALATATATQMFKDGHRTFEVVRRVVKFGLDPEKARTIVSDVRRTYGVDTRELRGIIPEST